MAKSRFTAAKESKPRRKKRTPKSSGGSARKGSNAWVAYVGSAGGSGGRYIPSNEPLPD
jgi:hypothetical protein